MYKYLFILCLAGFAACKSKPVVNTTNGTTLNSTSGNAATAGWTKEDEMEFLDGCVANSQKQLGDTQSYQLCKCILDQVKKKYPVLDSTTELALQDSARIAEMRLNCK